MKIFTRVAFALGLCILAGAGWVYFQLQSYPDIQAYKSLLVPTSSGGEKSLRTIFLGVSTILLDDGETAILTDGFFTRPNAAQLLLGKIAPDQALIANYLKRAGVDKLAAVIVQHSHYDHVMDSPEVARLTGAIMVGSESTANVGRGWGLPKDRIKVMQPGEKMDFGKFHVTLIESGHVPPGFPGGEITEPLIPPARATAYKVGTSYATLVEHEGTSILINASAGFAPGALRNRHADIVFLGIGMLGKRDEAYMESYWSEVVEAVGARRVIPIHWDNFARPLDQPLQPIPHLLDDFDATMNFLKKKGGEQSVEIMLLQAWQVMDLSSSN
jgi:L-ascorbate metabolism protein UlaG (beta-lactamase superfamily)